MKLLMVDNYDSFTWNLVHLFEELGAEVDVFRNDAITVDEAEALAPDRLVISPGPGRPEDAGVSVELIRALGMHTPRSASASAIRRSSKHSAAGSDAHRRCCTASRASFVTTAGVYRPTGGDRGGSLPRSPHSRCPTISWSPRGPRTAR